LPQDRVDDDRGGGDESFVISPEMFDNLRAIGEHCNASGELCSYDPETGDVELIDLRNDSRRHTHVSELRHGAQRRAPIVYVPERRENVAARPREHRSRSRTRQASRDGPDGDPEPPPVAFIRGFTAASERLPRHLHRRTAARYVA
jgi:hypothetical protein